MAYLIPASICFIRRLFPEIQHHKILKLDYVSKVIVKNKSSTLHVLENTQQSACASSRTVFYCFGIMVLRSAE